MATVKEITASYKYTFKMFMNGTDTFNSFEYCQTMALADDDNVEQVKEQLWNDVIKEVVTQANELVKSVQNKR
jgi:hypothetical protein